MGGWLGAGALLAAGLVVAGCDSDSVSESGLPRSAQLFDVTSRGGVPRQLTAGRSDLAQPTWSPTGGLIATMGQRRDRSEIQVRRSDGRLVRTFAGGGDPGQAAAWSPDGRELAFGFLRDTTEGARAKLRIVDLRGHSRELAERIDGRPAWSPGGRWLAFTTGEVLESVGPGNPPSRADLVVVRVRGKGGRARRLAGSDPDAHFDPSWSPDGRVILFSHADRGESWSIRAMVPTTGAQRTLVGRLIDAQPDWSPNGRQIAITATTLGGDGTAHLYVLARRGGRLRRLVRNVTGAPAWSPDGTLVAFPDGDRVRVIRADGKAGRTVARLRGADISDVDWSPDGKRLTFVAGRRPVES